MQGLCRVMMLPGETSTMFMYSDQELVNIQCISNALFSSMTKLSPKLKLRRNSTRNELTFVHDDMFFQLK
jgi:hypothetical protein